MTLEAGKEMEKEQEPKQIVFKKRKCEYPDGSIDYFAVWYCPNCGKLLKHGLTNSWIYYCCKCGQVVKWE